MDKREFREAVLQTLRQQTVVSRNEKSKAVLDRLKRMPEFRKSAAIMFYVSCAREVDTAPLLRQVLREGRCVVVPWVDKKLRSVVPVQIRDPEKDLVRGTYGILEPGAELVRPFEVSRLDLVLVPAVAFDRAGRRLGRGRGYYDRFLKSLPSRVKRYGLAFDCQVFDSIPVEDFDVSVDKVITNEAD